MDGSGYRGERHHRSEPRRIAADHGQTTQRQHHLFVFRGGQPAELETVATQNRGLRRELRRRVLLAADTEPAGNRQDVLRGDAPHARATARTGQESGAHAAALGQRGAEHDSLCGRRLRLSGAGSHAHFAAGHRQPLRVPHLCLRHRELAVLRPVAARRGRGRDAKRPSDFRCRAVSDRLFRSHLPAVCVEHLVLPHAPLRPVHHHRFSENHRGRCLLTEPRGRSHQEPAAKGGPQGGVAATPQPSCPRELWPGQGRHQTAGRHTVHHLPLYPGAPPI